ncbi:hypothetical protein G7009_13075 [Pseudomonas capeferrum]|uniref:hypothetical protein n=1 Tax=Pseudomonas capeferrum TaxID=1495066 RepID=UPI002158C378|nr:hypothetical protein [Pseudomonas capeferrum]MBA1202673.1 hypothetical protein [Pseudomonas capeferrum]
MPEEKKLILDSPDLDALQAVAHAAAHGVIRSHGWKGMIEDADLLGTDERYLVLADPSVVLALLAENEALTKERDQLIKDKQDLLETGAHLL